MSEVVDLTFLTGTLQGLEREVRLLRLQLEQLAGTVPSRLSGIDARLGTVEQSFHDLATEVGRSFGQIGQQLARQERRFDVIEVGLTSLRAELDGSTKSILRAIEGTA